MADTGLLFGNVFAWEFYNLISSAFIKQFGLEETIWNEYRKEIGEEGFVKTFGKLNLISSLISENSKEESNVGKKDERKLQKEFR